ncbi:hypothetical protein J3A83DRAFT_4399023 [Scleroderma citrinum]
MDAKICRTVIESKCYKVPLNPFLRAQLPWILAVLNVHINSAVMILEPPSNETLRVEQHLWSSRRWLYNRLIPPAEEGTRGPHPLSVKKKAVTTDGSAPPSGVGKGSCHGENEQAVNAEEKEAQE